MNNNTEKSLKLPIFLIVGPTAIIMLSIFLYAIVNFVVASATPEASSTSLFTSVTNVLLFLMGALSILAFIPCLVVGIIMLANRSSRQYEERASGTSDGGSRKWQDLE